MKYKLIIDKNADEEIIAIVHAPASLTQRIEDLVCGYFGAESIMGYSDDEMRKSKGGLTEYEKNCFGIFAPWLDFGVMPIVVFTAIFVVGYIVIWAIIYSIIKRNTDKLNKMLQQKQQSVKEDL